MATSPQRRVPPRQAKAGSMGHAMQEAAPFIGLGLQVAAAMAFFAGVGYLADRFLGTGPWGVILGCVMGVMAVFAVLYKLLIQLDQKDVQRRASGAERVAPPATKTSKQPFR